MKPAKSAKGNAAKSSVSPQIQELKLSIYVKEEPKSWMVGAFSKIPVLNLILATGSVRATINDRCIVARGLSGILFAWLVENFEFDLIRGVDALSKSRDKRARISPSSKKHTPRKTLRRRRFP